MAVQRAEEIIAQINEKIDARQMALLLNYFPEKIQDAGGQIKCFCPLHKEQAFRSLHLEVKTHTYNCKMKRCPGFDGGTFIDLWAVYTSQEVLEAALDIAEKLRLDIDVQALRALGGQMVEKAREALANDQLDQARTLVDQSVAFNPKDLEAGKLSAQIYVRAGDKDRAIAEFLRVVDVAIETSEFETARQILNPLVANDPRNVSFAERRVALARAENNQPALMESLLVAAVLYQENGQASGEMGALDELMALDPKDPRLLEHVVEIHERAGRPAKMAEAIERLTPVYEGLGEWAKAAAALERRLKSDPEDLEVRERLAKTFAKMGQPERGAGALFEIAEAYRRRNTPMRAQAILNQLLEIQPTNVKAMEALAALSAEMGHTRDAIEAYRKLAGLARQQGEMEEAIRYLNAARAIDPSNHHLRMDLVETHLAEDQVDRAITELFGLADVYFNEGNADEGFAILDRIRQLVPNDMGRQVEIGRCLEAAGYDEQALESHLGYLRRLEADEAYEDALMIAEEARRLSPRNEAVFEALVRINLATGRRPEAIALCRSVARLQSDAGDYRRAESALRMAASIDENDILIRADLAGLYEATGREADAVSAWIEVALLRRDTGEREGVVEAARSALRLDPNHAEAKAMLAEALEATGRVEEALELWKSSADALLASDPESAKALAILRHALELTPGDARLTGRIAVVALPIEGPEAALPEFERWIERARMEPDTTLSLEALEKGVGAFGDRKDWRLALADLYVEMGDPDSASPHLESLLAAYRPDGVDEPRYLPTLERLVRLNPARMDLRLEWAEALAETGDVDRAIEIFTALAAEHQSYGDDENCLIVLRKSVAWQPENREILLKIAELEEALGRLEEAVAAYEALVNLSRRIDTWRSNVAVLNKLLSLAPHRDDLRLELARNYEEHADIDSAVEQYHRVARVRIESDLGGDETLMILEKLVSLAKPDFVEPREMLVECYLERGDNAKAKAELEKLGDQALKSNDLDRGERMFRRIQEIDPDDIGSAERLGKLYETRGETDQAVASYRQALALYERVGDQGRMISALRKLTGLSPKDLELRRALARKLAAEPTCEDEAAEEWYDLIALAVAESDLKIAGGGLAETRDLFAERWDYRYKLIQIFSRVYTPAQTVQAWKGFISEALEAGKDQIAREAAGAALELAPEDMELLEARILANKRLEDFAAAEADLRTLATNASIQDDHATAEIHFKRALELNPSGNDLWQLLAESQVAQDKIIEASASLHRLAELYRETGDLAEAIARARRMVALQPTDTTTKDYLVELMLEDGQLSEAMDIWREIAENLADDAEFDAAIERYQAILEKLNRDIPALRRLADLTREARGSDEGAAAYHRLLDVMIEDAPRSEVRAEFERVIALEPGQRGLAEKYAEYLYNEGLAEDAGAAVLRIADLEREEGALEESLRLIRRVREWLPDSQPVMEAEAATLEAMGDIQAAAAALRMAITSYQRMGEDGRAAEALVRRAAILSDEVEPQTEAAEALQELEQHDRATDHYQRAVDLLLAADDYAGAIPIYQRLIRLNAGRMDLPRWLAVAYERVGRMDDAVREWLELASLNEQMGDPDAALEIYGHVKSVAPAEMEPRRRIARIAEENGDDDLALSELREMIPLAIEQEESEEAVGLLCRVISIDPADTDAMTTLADVQRGLGRTDDLFDTLLRLEQTYCDTDRLEDAARVMRDLRALRPDDLALAAQNFDLLVKLGDGDEAVRVAQALVQSHLDLGDVDQAERMLRRATNLEPTNIARRVEFAKLVESIGYDEIALREFHNGCADLLEAGDLEPALELAAAGLESFPKDLDLRRRKIEALSGLGRHEEKIAEALDLAAIFETRGDPGQALGVLDGILAEHSDHIETHERVIRLALEVGEEERTHEHLIQLAEIHYANGDLKPSIEALERLLKLAPARVELRIRLAELHYELGDTQEAQQVWFHAARDLHGAGRLDEAIAVYETVRQNYPKDSQTLAQLTELYREAGRDDAYLEHATLLGDVYDETGDYYEATRIFEALAERFPENPDIWEKLANAYRQVDDIDGAVKCHKALFELHQAGRRFDLAKAELEKALALRNDDVELLNQLGEVCLRLGQRVEGLAWLGRAAKSHTAASRFDEAREVIEHILKIDPANLETRKLLGSVCEALGDMDGAIKNYGMAAGGWADKRDNERAIEVYTKILEIDPTLIEEREAFAQTLEREGRKAEAADQYLTLIRSLSVDADPRQVIRYCRQILKDNPDHVEAHIELYMIYERTRKPRLALEEAQWLADYYIQCGDTDSAEDYIRRGLEQAPGEIELRKRFVEILIETSRTEEAALNLNELAGSAREAGDLKTAKWALNRACEIIPDNLDYRQELAELLELAGELAEARRARIDITRILLERGDMEAARKIAEKVVQSAPDDEQVRLAIAEIFEEAGLPEVAAFHLSHIAEAALKREDHARVVDYCERIMRMKPRHVQARELLVKATFALGDQQQAVTQSHELYSIHLDNNDLEEAHNALRFIIQCRPSEPEPRRMLIDLYRRMKRADPMVEQMRKLAEIYANEGNIESAVAVLKGLITERPDDTRARARYIDLYAQVGEESDLFDDFLHLALLYRRGGALVEASQVYEKLLKMEPERTESREQFVEFLFEQGQNSRGIEEARALIDLYLRGDRKVEAGRLLERALGHNPADTQMRHQLATLQIKTNRRGMALETLRGLLKQYVTLEDEDRQVEVIEQILQIDSLNVELRERLAELQLKMGRPEAAREQRVALAEQYLQRQLFDLAEREYQRILDANPADVEIWEKKIETHLQIGGEAEVASDMYQLANLLADEGRPREAVNYYDRLRKLDPNNIELISKYIEAYIQVGMEEDLIDTYLHLANLLSQSNNVEGALKIYQHLQELAPENSEVREGLKATDTPLAQEPSGIVAQAMRTADLEQDLDMPAPAPARPAVAESPRETLAAATRYPEPATSKMTEQQLENQIRNYVNILKLNPENPSVRKKLAELIARTGRMKEADEQWLQAANDFFVRGEYDQAIEILTELVGRHPDDARLRERLSRAILQRESLNAIGSVLDGPK